MSNDPFGLNAAGETLRTLGMGAVRLRYRPADDLIPRDTFAVWIEPANTMQIVGTGDTAHAAFLNMLAKLDQREAA